MSAPLGMVSPFPDLPQPQQQESVEKAANQLEREKQVPMEVDAEVKKDDAQQPAEGSATPPAASERARIEVVVRIRPESSWELSQGNHRNIIQLQDNVIFIHPDDPKAQHIAGSKRRKPLQYLFDKVYGTDSTQLQVFEGTVKPLLPPLFDGYNASVFCYGATGAGKTFTMMGDEHSMPGVIPLSVANIFEMAADHRQMNDVTITLSYCEIYNEAIRDLLAEEQKPLDFRVGQNGGQVAGLTWWEPQDGPDVLRLINLGNAKRVKAETNVNELSSRSHAILQMRVQTKQKGAEVNTTAHIGKLSLIDLAGSERAAATENRGLRLKEGANINKSLLALGNVINALASKKASCYVGYRDSKLTRMLKDSLGGNCRTVMMTNISPSVLTYEDTHNALKYANRAKCIKVDLKRNTAAISAHIRRYKSIIENLQNQVSYLQQQVADYRAKHKEAMERTDVGAGAASGAAKELERRLAEVTAKQITGHQKLAGHEAQRNEALLKLRRQEAEITRWSHVGGEGEQEPVRIVTLRADIVMLQSQVAVADCEIHSVKTECQQLLRESAELKSQIPLLPLADQRYLEPVAHLHTLRIEKVQQESWVQYHKSREKHWEQRCQEVEQGWATATARMAEALKCLTVAREGGAADLHQVADAVKRCLAGDAAAPSPPPTGRLSVGSDDAPCGRTSVGLGLNYLERPKRVVAAKPPNHPSYMKATNSSAAKKEAAPSAPHAPGSATRRSNSAGGVSVTSQQGSVRRADVALPSYMKATTSSSVKQGQQQVSTPRGCRPPQKATTPQLAVTTPGKTPRVAGRTLTPCAHTPDQVSERSNLLEERRRQRKLLALAAEEAATTANTPAPLSSALTLKLPLGSAVSRRATLPPTPSQHVFLSTRGRKRSLGTSAQLSDGDEPSKRGRLSDDMRSL